MMAKKTMPSNARLLLTALEPSAIPSARACIHSPTVVLERLVAGSTDVGFDDARSNRGDDGRDDIGIDECSCFESIKGGKYVNRCIIKYPVINAKAIAK